MGPDRLQHAIRPGILGLCVLMAGTMFAHAEPPAAIACAGPFGIDATEADLKTAFGAENVVYKSVDGPEGTTSKASVVFDTDPARRIEVHWRDAAKRKGPTVIVSAPSAWVGPEGLHVGMGLAEVEDKNGAPFPLYGFGWDYGGAAHFQEGKLMRPEGGCSLMLTFSPGVELTEHFNAIQGDGQFLSSDPLMREAKPAISQYVVTYPAEERDIEIDGGSP